MWIILICIAMILSIILFHLLRRQTISSTYNKAKYYYDTGNITKSISVINKGNLLTRAEKYTYEDAKYTIKVLQLLQQICKNKKLEKDTLINPIINALKAIPLEGGEIDVNTNELKKFVYNISKDLKNKHQDSFNQFTEEYDNTKNIPKY